MNCLYLELLVPWITLKSEFKPSLTLREILSKHLSSTTAPLNIYQRSVLTKLQHCKTAHLGGHWQVCGDCGHLEKHYHSCSNRHCPGCQGANKERWIMEREYDLFDVPHHHVTFTAPAELRTVFYHHQKELYALLFQCMWATLQSFSKNPRSRLEAKIGVIAILHTWTQKLEYHPHLHCIVPAGGLKANGEWKAGSGKFLFNVKNLSTVFKTKFCDGLKALHDQGKIKTYKLPIGYSMATFINFIRAKEWVVNSKNGFAGKSSVVEYLGRYTHKIAISNYRLIKLENQRVTFSYRDRRDGDIKKVMSLPVDEFITRFSWHILPRGLVKIRHYGLFSTRTKTQELALVRKALGEAAKPQPQKKLTIAEVIFQTTGRELSLCRQCNEGVVMIVEEIPPIRGSPYQPRKLPQPINT